jgi:NADH-quinone oxidoreductase subunit L
MFKLETLMVLVPALPLLAALTTAFFGKWLLKSKSHVPVVVALALSFFCSLGVLSHVRSRVAEQAEQKDGAKTVGVEKLYTLWTWASIDHAYKHTEPTLAPNGTVATKGVDSDFQVDITLRADPLTAIMLSMVTFISTLVAIYAIGYMHDDPGYWRFFTYVALFVFSMTMLVSVSNFALLYVFWEAVGVCSYLLIGFWFQKPEAAAAGKKAFLVNRIGDFGFALGVFLIWTTYGSLNFHDVTNSDGVVTTGVLGQTALQHPELLKPQAAFGLSSETISLLIALGLFVGACGKSAQFPLHVWLPDAMEGPTPVSALIHAATMVTAGVYLVARCSPLFSLAPEAQMVVAGIGGFTALLAGLIAMTQYDLKRVLAYSTVSQLGYMFLGLGTGSLAGIVAGMFHLFTHAFFKALLFLGAGSVMHAMGHVIDMRRFSGLRHLMPWTFRTFWFGCLALAGIFPFAGFWSKDAILAAVHDRIHGAVHEGAVAGALFNSLYYAALFTAFLTAFYTFRALFMTFYGEERIPPEAGHHAHESPPPMTVPLVILAICALVVGVYYSYMTDSSWAEFLVHTPSLAFAPVYHHGLAHEFHIDVAVISTVVAVLGLGLAAYFYLGDRREITALAGAMQKLMVYQLSAGKFFFDQIYNALIVWPLKLLAGLSYWFDRNLVDGLVNLVGRVPVGLGTLLRALQNGLVQFYALAMVLGLLVLIGTLLVWPI